MSKFHAGIVAIVAGLGLSLAVVGCSSSSGNSGDNKMNADKMSGEATMSPGNMDGKMPGENKMSGNGTMATNKMNADKVSGEGKMNPGNMDGKMSGETKTSK
jgi:hypothetical protein